VRHLSKQTAGTLLAFLAAAVLVVTIAVAPASSLAAESDGAQSDGPPPRFIPPEAGEGPPAPTGVTAIDVPNDAGETVSLSWVVPAGVTPDSIVVYRFDAAGDSEMIALLAGDERTFTDPGAGHEPVRYAVELFLGGLSARSSLSTAVVAQGNWFNKPRGNQLIVLLVIVVSIGYFTLQASKGREFYIRKIAGLEAVDEAVGRATEMGRSVLYIPGTQDLDDVQTLAGLTILGTLSKKIAEYETKIDVPVCRSLVMSTGRETVREAYLLAGRPDLYNDDIVHYITDEQFGYVAAVDGIMVREKPAACFYLGAFFAESLILAETGNSIGAIQVAGTAMPTQLPFFVAACDYTLIGEELFAASAYLSKDLKLIGSLRGQDIGKLLAMAGVAVGVIAATAGWDAIETACHWLFKVN